MSASPLPALLLLLGLLLPMPLTAHAASFVTSDGVRLAYQDVGAGAPALIFIPGWTMPSSIWRPQIEHFTPTHRVIAFDPRGQGDSDIPAQGYTPERRAQDIAELIAASGADHPVIVGWSLAVLEALAYVKLHGDAHLGGLVLVDNSVGEEPPPVSKFDIIAALRSDREHTVRNFVAGMFKTPQAPAYLDALDHASLRMPLADCVALLSYPWPRTEWRDALYSTRKPVLYVVTPHFAAQAANVHKKRPDIATEVFHDAGHALFVDRPDRFNALLDHFLLRLDAAR